MSPAPRPRRASTTPSLSRGHAWLRTAWSELSHEEQALRELLAALAHGSSALALLDVGFKIVVTKLVTATPAAVVITIEEGRSFLVVTLSAFCSEAVDVALVRVGKAKCVTQARATRSTRLAIVTEFLRSAGFLS